jgi:predicted metalloprotease with PDZ domain
MFRNSLFMMMALVASVPAVAQKSTPIRIRIDLTDAPRRIIHVMEQLPAHAGDNVFAYPKWIPGRERADGPVDNLTGLVFHAGTADGASVAWRQDLSDPYKFHVRVPVGVTSLAASYDVLKVNSDLQSEPTKRTSVHVVAVEPSDVVLYPDGKLVRDMPITATLHLPGSWKAATALRASGASGPSLSEPDTTFETVSVEQLVDSPILAGDHCRQYPLAPEIHPAHTLDICTDKEADLNVQPAFLAKMNALVEQTTKVFVGHHYEHYDFLVAASSHLRHEGTEHTQSSDDIVSSADTSNPNAAGSLAAELSHEFVHSWCGKYRRPVGIATGDYSTPMQDDLIWVYEGLTQYYGEVLATRAGFQTPAETISAWDYSAFLVDQPGRRWRSLQGTADAATILRDSDPAWGSWRLAQDYYRGGALLWLDADMKIRELTHGAKSLDDFAALFFAPAVQGSRTRDTGPGVLPYAFADLVKALNATAPYDWKTFWEKRLNGLDIKSLTGGLEAGGYDYVYRETMGREEADYNKQQHIAELYHSLGFQAMGDGALEDVWVGSPAYTAGLGPGDTLTAVNGKPYSAELLTAAVHDSKTNPGPIVLTATREGESQTFSIDYHGGELYEALVRNGRPDLLTTVVLKPK